MDELHGTCDPRFEAVRDILATQLDTGADLGASVAVYLHGEPVVDIWGGWADLGKTKRWGRDTITNVWSTTKTMTFLVALDLGRSRRARLPHTRVEILARVRRQREGPD